MISLLFALVFWWTLMFAAASAVLLLACFGFWIADSLRAPSRDREQGDSLERVLARLNAGRPFDQDDPLEQMLALPSAPNPRWRV